jgi:hypothetical protein
MNQPDHTARAVDLAARELADRGRELAELARTEEHLNTLQRAQVLVALAGAAGRLDALLERLRDAALYHGSEEEESP